MFAKCEMLLAQWPNRTSVYRSIKILHSVSARYSLENPIRSVSEGNSFTVTLVISANPQPTDGETIWSYGSAPLVDGVTGTANSLSFVNINRVQSGVYTVSSTTSAGTSMDFTVNINVVCECISPIYVDV